MNRARENYLEGGLRRLSEALGDIGSADPFDAAVERLTGKNGPSEVETHEDEDAALEAAGVKYVGGGWYELPNGEKAHGRNGALKAISEGE